MDEKDLKEELLKLIKEKAVVRGERKLASGKVSNYYIDGKQVTLDPQGLYMVGKMILRIAQAVNADAVGGPTLGADPIAAGVSLLSSHTGKPLKAFIVRKEAKDHGMQKMIEGPVLAAGDKVVMVEDVITTGGSVLKAIKAVEDLGAKVVKVICLVDRNEGAQETLAHYNYAPIFTLKELGL
ncbi:MAG TPA: orotate phosphoribosyltransferase [Candidatus Omnitrophota bacterium]|jgi:orotate phosphoribosyltransferase|nr:orotate phosphoribosyltransferase [Candidatus Omnitrophota bacterium]HQB94131.1 orotate phosphoribosyltransferase [Candidatus Omnitrophota bacterium]